MVRLKRKTLVQKSFRLDEDLAEDLETLSKVLERPQNDLVNLAIEDLLKENEVWFRSDVFNYLLKSFIVGDLEEDVVTFQNVVVRAFWEDSDTLYPSFHVIVEDDAGAVVDDYTKKASEENSIQDILREAARYLDLNSKEIGEYIKTRFSYK